MFSFFLAPLLAAQLLTLPLDQWSLSYEGNLDTMKLTQYVPKGESQEHWTRQINFMHAKGVTIPPQQMFHLMVDELMVQLPNQRIESTVLEESPQGIIGEFWFSPDSTIHEHSWVKITQADEGVTTLLYTVKDEQVAQKEREQIVTFLRQHPAP